ncbi:NitT/TauT family transport system substrate-binding protein [Stella humosa]|uniref:NitT/TauT family transport system substrate-binding protein n=1 Tax=Stella humosa TaxID=94 RepID=A0A3N1MJC2_9PROT|nr:ABC transporter substrate-binding protein [Stella humosa]ROQ03315.1 NitT/TauT family transport system substrate-binding protein [Stella humosa]BBK33313.1 ABC transporter substrate-binding protein [Stella humosa]
MAEGAAMMRVAKVLAVAVGIVLPTAAVAQTAVKFSLDFRFQGPQAVFTGAAEKGMFAAEKLAVQVDAANGSGDAVNRVASGAYDIGFADISAMIRFNAQNPDRPLVAVFVAYDSSPLSILSLKAKGIARPADLAGKTIGAPDLDTGRQIFPVFAKANAIDPAKLTLKPVDIRLREPLLVRGEVDAITGFVTSARFNLMAIGVKPEDIAVIRYADHGVDLYSNAVIVQPAYAEKNPEVVRGFLRATVKAMNESLRDPLGMAETLKKRDATVDAAFEAERLKFLNELLVLTPHVKANGYSSVDAARMTKAIALVADAYGVAPPALGTVYTDRFLPPAAERMPPK